MQKWGGKFWNVTGKYDFLKNKEIKKIKKGKKKQRRDNKNIRNIKHN